MPRRPTTNSNPAAPASMQEKPASPATRTWVLTEPPTARAQTDCLILSGGPGLEWDGPPRHGLSKLDAARQDYQDSQLSSPAYGEGARRLRRRDTTSR